MYYYVYRLDHIETGEFYIGSRGSKYHPTVDSYMGSMRTWKPDKSKLIKTIIKDDFKNREDTFLFESDLISKNINEDLNRNYHIPSKGYHTTGMVSVIDCDGKHFIVPVNDPLFLSGELKHTLRGRITVIDSNNKTYSVFKDDPRYLSGELVFNLKGYITCKDNEGKTFSITVTDPRFISGEVTGLTKGKLLCKDGSGNIFLVSKTDEKVINGELIYIWKGKVHSNETKNKIGKANIENHKGNKNSQFGTMWITNGVSNKKTKKEEIIPNGWYKGRI